jgi:hypothetical protein
MHQTKRVALAMTLAAAAIAGPLAAYDQPKIHGITAKDHVVIFGHSTTAAGSRTGGYVQLLVQALGEQLPVLVHRLSALT